MVSNTVNSQLFYDIAHEKIPWPEYDDDCSAKKSSNSPPHLRFSRSSVTEKNSFSRSIAIYIARTTTLKTCLKNNCLKMTSLTEQLTTTLIKNLYCTSNDEMKMRGMRMYDVLVSKLCWVAALDNFTLIIYKVKCLTSLNCPMKFCSVFTLKNECFPWFLNEKVQPCVKK